jgi:UPF0755 protein
MGRVGRMIGIFVLVIGIASAAGAFWMWGQYQQPGPLAAETVHIVPRGADIRTIAGGLTSAGIITSPLMFILGARIDQADGTLKAGEYRFPPGISAREVVALLKSGRTVVRRLTVPEGLTTAQIIGLIEETPGLEGKTGPPPLEGTLLPETYHFAHGDGRREVVARMADAMTKTLDELWASRAPDLPFTSPREAVILASIVEKETALPAERPRVAAVFINRLRAGMRLEADPTVIYAVTGGSGPLGRSLTRDDLKRPSPYNTYVSEGLPPGPIANPGRASLAAVLDPADTDELYFVADGSGGHAFARTLEQHERNVARWRRINKNAKKPKD